MTEIVFDEENLILTASGHAGGGSCGNDIICAALSILIYTLAADAALMFGGGRESGRVTALSPGKAKIDCTEIKSDRRARELFESVCTGFELLSLRYPKNVSFKRKMRKTKANSVENS